MNIYRAAYGGILLLVVALFNSGCAIHPKTMVNTWSDPAYTPTATSAIALNLPVGAKPEDAAFGNLLQAELAKESFHLVAADQADYLLSYVVSANEEEYEGAAIRTLGPPGTPAQTTDQIVNPTGGPMGVNDSPGMPYYVETRDARLFLYTNPKGHAGGLRLAWQGGITIKKNATPEQQTALIRKLLENFGKNFNGPVKMESPTAN